MESNTTEAPTATTTPMTAEAQVAELQKKEAARLAKMKTDIGAKYPHAMVETLRWDSTAKKFQCKIKCVVSGDTSRWVYTSDLFQVNKCEAEAAKAKKALKAQKKADTKAALELIKAGGLNK